MKNLSKENNELIYKMFRRSDQQEWHYFYSGTLTVEITDQILSLTEQSIHDFGEPASVRKRVYFILVECLQNITHYQKKGGSTRYDAFFALQKNQNHYLISTANVVEKQQTQELKERLETINRLNSEQLKAYYKKILSDGKFSESGGAGLGLINMARKAGGTLKYDFFPVSNQYDFFFLHTSVSANKKDGQDKPAKPDFSLQRVKELMEVLRQQHICLLFNSLFSQKRLVGLLKLIEARIEKLHISKKRMFLILVEMLQNIVQHADFLKRNDEASVPGIFYIREKQGQIVLSAGNYIGREKVQPFEEFLDQLNHLSLQEIDQRYSEKLFRPSLPENKRSGLGMMDIRLKSSKPLRYSFRPVDEKFVFFLIEVCVENQ